MKSLSENRTRLDTLDWLHVLSIFNGFIFHTIRPFVFIDWAGRVVGHRWDKGRSLTDA